MNFLKYFSSFIYPLTVEKASSAVNPLLEVRIENGKYVLNAANANYSFGSLHRVFLNAFHRIKIGDRGVENVLLLGLGAGSVPELLFEEFNVDCNLTAVEMDEKVIELGKKYFNIQRFDKLKYICTDAFKYVQQSDSLFDLIIVDLFIDNKVPGQFESSEFLFALKELMTDKSILLFNKIIEIENGEESFNKLMENVKKAFTEIRVLNIFENRLIAASGKYSFPNMI